MPRGVDDPQQIAVVKVIADSHDFRADLERFIWSLADVTANRLVPTE